MIRLVAMKITSTVRLFWYCLKSCPYTIIPHHNKAWWCIGSTSQVMWARGNFNKTEEQFQATRKSMWNYTPKAQLNRKSLPRHCTESEWDFPCDCGQWVCARTCMYSSSVARGQSHATAAHTLGWCPSSSDDPGAGSLLRQKRLFRPSINS